MHTHATAYNMRTHTNIQKHIYTCEQKVPAHNFRDLNLNKRRKSNWESRARDETYIAAPNRTALPPASNKIHPFYSGGKKENSETWTGAFSTRTHTRVRSGAVCYFFQLPSFALFRSLSLFLPFLSHSLARSFSFSLSLALRELGFEGISLTLCC